MAVSLSFVFGQSRQICSWRADGPRCPDGFFCNAAGTANGTCVRIGETPEEGFLWSGQQRQLSSQRPKQTSQFPLLQELRPCHPEDRGPIVSVTRTGSGIISSSAQCRLTNRRNKSCANIKCEFRDCQRKGKCDAVVKYSDDCLDTTCVDRDQYGGCAFN